MNNREKVTMAQGAARVCEAIEDAIPEHATNGEVALAFLDILTEIFVKMYPEGNGREDSTRLDPFIRAFIEQVARKRERNSKTS